MAVPHYAYLQLKMPGPKGVITVKGNFQKSDLCDREFSKISETFGMEATLADLAISNDRTLCRDPGLAVRNTLIMHTTTIP